MGFVEAAHANGDVLADWILIRPEPARAGLTYEHHVRRAGTIGRREHSATLERNAKHIEPTWRRPCHVHARHNGEVCRGPVREIDLRVTVATGQRGGVAPPHTVSPGNGG